MWFRSLAHRVQGLFRQRALNRRLEEEFRFHLDMETEKNRDGGMDPEDARVEAQRAFGGTERIKERYREQWGLPGVETVLKDLQYAARGFRRNPGFAAVVIVSLALGIGANTAIFTLMDAVIFQSLPVRSQGELVSIGDASRPTAFLTGGPMANVFSYPLYRRLRDENQAFTGLMASGKSGRLDVALARGAAEAAAEEARGRLVSDNYFEVLGVPPLIGRVFSSEDDRVAAASPVVVISYDYWTSRFGRDASVLGSILRINGSPFTVIGVAQQNFNGEVVGSPADIWIPLSMQPLVNPGDARLGKRDSNWLLCMGRLKPGVSIQRARAEVSALVQNALIEYKSASTPEKLREIRGEKVEVQPGGKGFSWIRKHDAPLLFTLMAMAGLVLLIACANTANILLARGANRQKEMSMRLALGAGRMRLVRQLLTESALLAISAGTIGAFIASWGSLALLRIVSAVSGPNPIPFEVDVHPSMTVLGFTLGISVLTAILFGLAPALRATRVDVAPALKEGASGGNKGQWGLGRVLVAGQLALSIVILMGAGLFLRSIAHLDSLDVGYSRSNVVVMAVDLAGSGYPEPQRLAVMNRLLEFLAGMPGVTGATASSNGIFSHLDSSTDSLQVDGFVPARKEDSLCSFDQVGPLYFRVLGVPVIAGREFDEHDSTKTSNVAIINETMARFYFGTSDPLGKVLRNGGDRYTVVGVVKDMKERSLKSKTERRFYGPLSQSTDPLQALNFEIRTRDAAAPMTEAIRSRLRIFDPDLKVSSIATAGVLIGQDTGGDRMIATLSSFFGVLVLLLTANGLYGIVSHTTARRTNEIGLRMALGADRGNIIRMILRETGVLVAAGFVIGVPAALAGARLIAASLAGVSPNDPRTLVFVSAVLLTTGLVACIVPAARASHIDPMVALRQD